MSRSLQIPEEVVMANQVHSHDVIRGRVGELIVRHNIRLPELAELLASGELSTWFPLPWIDGGFHYWFEGEGDSAKLISECWSRIAGGSSLRHEISAKGSELVDEGFI